MTVEETKVSPKYFIGMVVAMLLWGVAWTTGKAAAEHSNAEVAAFWRYAISFISLLPIVLYMRIPYKTDIIGALYIIGAGLLTALFNYLFFAGVAHGQAGYGGTMVTAIAPIFTYFLAILVFKAKVNSRQIGALAIGSIGAIILLKIPTEGLGFLNVDSLFFLECAIVWAVVTIFSQKASVRAHALFYTIVVFGVTAFTNMMFALPHHPFDLGAYDSVFWYNIIFMGLFPGTFSTALFFISAGKIGASRTGVFMFIVPVGAVVSSWAVYDEHIEMSTVIGSILAFVAVVLFNLKSKVVRNDRV